MQCVFFQWSIIKTKQNNAQTHKTDLVKSVQMEGGKGALEKEKLTHSLYTISTLNSRQEVVEKNMNGEIRDTCKLGSFH